MNKQGNCSKRLIGRKKYAQHYNCTYLYQSRRTDYETSPPIDADAGTGTAAIMNGKCDSVAGNSEKM